MTSAAIINAESTLTGSRTQAGEEHWGAQAVARTGNTKLKVTGDRLAPARGAFLGITLGAPLWATLLLLILPYFMGHR